MMRSSQNVTSPAELAALRSENAMLKLQVLQMQNFVDDATEQIEREEEAARKSQDGDDESSRDPNQNDGSKSRSKKTLLFSRAHTSEGNKKWDLLHQWLRRDIEYEVKDSVKFINTSIAQKEELLRGGDHTTISLIANKIKELEENLAEASKITKNKINQVLDEVTDDIITVIIRKANMENPVEENVVEATDDDMYDCSMFDEESRSSDDEAVDGKDSSMSSRDSLWNKRLNELKEFMSREKHSRVPYKYDRNPSLGRWVHKQRVQYRQRQKGQTSTLTDKRLEYLERIGFSWNSNGEWLEMFLELKRFKNECGHCRVPRNYKENIRLGKWVYEQRRQYKNKELGKPSQMTQQRLQALEGLGFEWNSFGAWRERYEELKDFKKEKGHCRVPRNYYENPKLGEWVRNQRRQYRLRKENKQSPMTAERIDLLEKIGFTWNAGNTS